MNVLDYFRIKNRNVKNSAKFIKDIVSNPEKLGVNGVDQDNLDVMTLIFLSMGSPEPVERFIIEYTQIMQELKQQSDNEKLSLQAEKK